MSKEIKRVADAVKPALATAISAQAYAALIAIPYVGAFFALPVISHFTRAILDRVAEWLIQETAVGLSVLWIQVEMAYEVDSAEKAAAKLGAMLNDPKGYTETELKKNEDYFDETTVDLIQLGLERLA